jgi:hypothetical protein
LVSKAIVQAVQQQNPPGRFLEIKTKDVNGLWKQIPYKRAVDKTSQALREKEAGVNDQDSLAPLTNMPIGLTGRPKGEEKQGEAAAKQERANDMNEITKMTLAQAGLEANNGPDYKGPVAAAATVPMPVTAASRKRKAAPPEFIKPSWWSKGSPSEKKSKQQEEDQVPLTEPLQIRQTSMFHFLSEATGIFGRNPSVTPSIPSHNQMGSSSGFAMGGCVGNNDPNQNQVNQGMNMGQAAATARAYDEELRNGRSSAIYEERLQHQNRNMSSSGNNMQSAAAAVTSMDRSQNRTSSSIDSDIRAEQLMRGRISGFQSRGEGSFNIDTNMRGSFSQQHQQSQRQSSSMGENSDMFDNSIAEFQPVPLPHVNGGYNNHNNNMGQQGNIYGNYSPTMQNNMGCGGIYHPQPAGGVNNSQQSIPPYAAAPPREQGAAVPPPVNRLTTQVSDWLNSFWPLGKDGLLEEPKEETPPPPVFEPGISSTLMGLVRTPSRLLTSLKSGVTSMIFAEINSDNNNSNHSSQSYGQSVVPPPPSNNMAPHMLGNASSQRRDSLLDDYEETPLEKSLRSVSSR